MTPFGAQPSLDSDFFPPRRVYNAWRAGKVAVKPKLPPMPRNRCRAWKPSVPLPEPISLKIPLSPARRIVKVACLMFGVTHEQLLSHNKYKLLVDARQYAAVRLKKELKMSTPEIAMALNRKDHTTIVSLLRRVAR